MLTQLPLVLDPATATTELTVRDRDGVPLPHQPLRAVMGLRDLPADRRVLSDVAETIRSSSDSLPAGADGISRYINQAADRVDEVASFLHDSELSDIVGTVEDFARRQPAAFLGGAFALGILGA